MKYFSDKEQGMPPRTLTEINVAIWNGIILRCQRDRSVASA